MRSVQEVLPHELQQPADTGEAQPGLRLDVRAVLARARGGGGQPQAGAALDAGGAQAQVERASPTGARPPAQGPSAGGEGGEPRDQALQDVAVPVFRVCTFRSLSSICFRQSCVLMVCRWLRRAGSTPSPKIRWVSVALFVDRLITQFGLPDPDDLIFPRAATRVGPKYQVSALPVPGDDPPGERAVAAVSGLALKNKQPT